MATDRVLFWAILNARDVDVPPTLRRPWQLAVPWPQMADLDGLERLMALGCLVPVRTPRGLRVLIPEQLASALPPAEFTSVVALPLGPTLTSIRADALVLLGCLAVGRPPLPVCALTCESGGSTPRDRRSVDGACGRGTKVYQAAQRAV